MLIEGNGKLLEPLFVHTGGGLDSVEYDPALAANLDFHDSIEQVAANGTLEPIFELLADQIGNAWVSHGGQTGALEC